MKHLDRLFLYTLFALFMKLEMNATYWWAPLIMLPLIVMDAISDVKKVNKEKKEKKNERTG